ncbi:MAG: protein kinase domain-containing protein [Desulfonatronovibrionaceae bacterium]
MYLGKYKATGLLGRGGMGTIYKVDHPRLHSTMALKLLSPREELEAVLGRKALREMFTEEARAMSRLDHPHVVPVFDLDECARGLFMVMPFYCWSLASVMRLGTEMDAPSLPLHAETIFTYSLEALSGLEAMHATGMIHRDINPGNLLLTPDNRVRLIDLGLCKKAGAVESTPRAMKVGSQFYTAPEQEKNPEKADKRADLYSMGVTVCRMLTGFLPDKNGKPKDPPHPEDKWESFLTRAVHADPDKRFSSAEEMKLELASLRREWQKARENTCSLWAPEQKSCRLREDIRSRPVKTGVVRADQAFDVDGFGRPLHSCTSVLKGPGPVFADHTYGLRWYLPRANAAMPMSEAESWLSGINERENASWRLPTVDELLTIIRPKKNPSDYCLAFAHEHLHPRIWSADRRSFASYWCADVLNGFISHADKDCLLHILAVSRTQNQTDEEE